jgi:transposase-like protein
MALEMYLEGLGFRAIGRLLRISFGTVYQWIRKWGGTVDLPVKKEPVCIVELDETHSYVMKKNYCWTWIAVDRSSQYMMEISLNLLFLKLNGELCILN